MLFSVFEDQGYAVYGLDATRTRGEPVVPTAAVAYAVGQALLNNELIFINWEGGFTYGPALVVDGLYELDLGRSGICAEHGDEDKYADCN